MKKILFVIALLVAFHGITQNVPPTAVKNSFVKNFPGITVKSWNKEGDKWEANFVKEGKTASATFDVAGTLQETETDINTTELPVAITNWVKTNRKGARIKEAAIIERGNQKLYEAEVNGKDILFDWEGKFVKEEKD